MAPSVAVSSSHRRETSPFAALALFLLWSDQALKVGPECCVCDNTDDSGTSRSTPLYPCSLVEWALKLQLLNDSGFCGRSFVSGCRCGPHGRSRVSACWASPCTGSRTSEKTRPASSHSSAPLPPRSLPRGEAQAYPRFPLSRRHFLASRGRELPRHRAAAAANATAAGPTG